MSIEAPEFAPALVSLQPPAAPVRVKFGPRPNQDMPLSWAEFMLSAMREAQEKGHRTRHFGELLAAAAMESGR